MSKPALELGEMRPASARALEDLIPSFGVHECLRGLSGPVEPKGCRVMGADHVFRPTPSLLSTGALARAKRRYRAGSSDAMKSDACGLSVEAKSWSAWVRLERRNSRESG